MKYSYGWEKMHAAVLTLIGPESMRDRLEGAYMHFSISRLKPEQLPEDIRPDFTRLMERISGTPAGPVGRLHEAVNNMPEDEVHAHAKLIFSMYDSVCRYQQPHIKAR